MRDLYRFRRPKAIKPDLFRKSPLRFAPNAVTQQVIELVSAQFGDHFGAVVGSDWATTRQEAHRALDAFVANALLRFGDEQDAIRCSAMIRCCHIRCSRPI